MNFAELANILRIGVDAARFVASVVPSLVELWEAHDRKDDVVIQAIDAALILKRAANDRALAEKVYPSVPRPEIPFDGVAEEMAARDDEPTAEIGLPGAKR